MTARESLHSLPINRRRFLIGSAAAAASAVLAACGGSSTAPTATGAATKVGGATIAGGSTPAAGATPVAQTTGGATPTFAPISTAGSQQVTTSIQNPPQGKPQGNKPSELVLAWGTNQLTTHGIDGQLYLATIAESQLRHIYEPMVKVERPATSAAAPAIKPRRLSAPRFSFPTCSPCTSFCSDIPLPPKSRTPEDRLQCTMWDIFRE